MNDRAALPSDSSTSRKSRACIALSLLSSNVPTRGPFCDCDCFSRTGAATELDLGGVGAALDVLLVAPVIHE